MQFTAYLIKYWSGGYPCPCTFETRLPNYDYALPVIITNRKCAECGMHLITVIGSSVTNVAIVKRVAMMHAYSWLIYY